MQRTYHFIYQIWGFLVFFFAFSVSGLHFQHCFMCLINVWHEAYPTIHKNVFFNSASSVEVWMWLSHCQYYIKLLYGVNILDGRKRSWSGFWLIDKNPSLAVTLSTVLNSLTSHCDKKVILEKNMNTALPYPVKSDLVSKLHWWKPNISLIYAPLPKSRPANKLCKFSSIWVCKYHTFFHTF